MASEALRGPNESALKGTAPEREEEVFSEARGAVKWGAVSPVRSQDRAQNGRAFEVGTLPIRRI